MKVTVHSKGVRRDFTADASTSLLVAGLADGIALPYSCASGTCGTCKARVTVGGVDDMWPSAPGKKGFRDEQQILMCQCVARDDCEIEISDAVQEWQGDLARPGAQCGRITRWNLLTHDVASWEITLDAPMDFEAGQFVLVRAPGVKGYRAYSMVNYDEGSTTIELLMKRKPDGALSELLFEGNPNGLSVDVIGPLGRAVLSPDSQKHFLCISGGSGVAGMMSILSRAASLSHFVNRRGYFFFGVRTMRDSFFLERLMEFSQAASGGLDVVVCLSDEPVPNDASAQFPNLSFEQGFVHEVAMKRMAGNLTDVHAFLAGPPPAVDAAMRGLVIQGKLSPKSISFDKFS